MKIPFQKHSFTFLLCVLLLSSCSQGGSNDPDEPKERELVLPGKPMGILPTNAETCSDFEEVPGEANRATIHISWSAAENATSYILQVFESDTEVSNTTATTTETELTLEKGKSYSWTVTAKNSDGETQSDTFSFTTPGEAIGNFVPYAAEISMDFDANSGELVISWVGNDEDGDPLTYDVVVKEDDVIIEEHEDLITVELDPIIALAGVIYTVQVTSKDDFGNFSVSVHTEKITN